MKKFFILILIVVCVSSFAQVQVKNDLYVKANAILLPIGVVNVALEKQISTKYTLQSDVLISPWKSFRGHELQYYSFSVEGRYYLKEAFKHLYFGVNFSTATFVLQKWSYWNDSIYTNDNNESFILSNLYQKGFSFILGVTVGYQFKLSENFNMDVYATVGNSQDLYKGYDRTTGERYDVAKKINKSGEFLPYRGGIMISYNLR